MQLIDINSDTEHIQQITTYTCHFDLRPNVVLS